MNNKYDDDANYNPVASIKVVGVGGGGNNSIKTLLNTQLDGLEFIIANTDKQVLEQFDRSVTLQLGDKKGLGAGAKPEIGRAAALASADEIKTRLKGADLVIITAGMGGGTGTGASPVIAKIAKECGALVVAIVTTPFDFEGPKRTRIANDGIKELIKHVDSYIVISNNKLLMQYGNVSYNDAFICANNVLKQTIRTLVDVIAVPGIINLDFADLETIIKNSGEAVVGIGAASGEDRATKAITSAISSPILESSIVGATDAIVYFIASKQVTLNEIQRSLKAMRELVGQEINIIFGLTNTTSEESEKLGELFVSVIATGLKKDAPHTPEEIQKEISENLKKTEEIEYDDLKTREFLIENPYIPKDFSNSSSKNNISDDLADIFKKI
ncbi:cell division protein FtsZ [Metamycoplasma hyosynoviae]|uniref:Cell division protein FtsZ n=1 Tax=Metamycoplasma hyosynoviae TaxID=29559 RepID=A0A4P1QGD8_9BACT|nr:cell division protein FtsZ [Metamycoplasma hyosynoviae]ASI54000.1 cell division protein FtsZ [Metamycoplasma hyosynoviae]MDC8962856.1 cell division protein FtsZ [Metamycoplasma hyosynoviae]MDD1373533.1 cell division protein FtsZ [Metamycoplasma hyosynoviae]MDD1375094.1 cell division protein FtsZ [Metamycoplasma hyosynoviae]MDD1375829.1 cell division protein FtsZ [Metamycoplasma hyosynoviae]